MTQKWAFRLKKNQYFCWMNKFFQNILCDPETKMGFNSIDSKHLTTANFQYDYIDKIPNLLPKNFREIENKSQIHLDFGSEFDYTAHYKLDAKIHDYTQVTAKCSATEDEFRRIHQSIKSRIDSKIESILDVGCGEAWVAKEYIKRGKKVISMDISEENPSRAVKNYKSENHIGIIADAYHIPLKDNSIDCVIASEIIEHVINPKEFIDELLRVIKPGGKLIITTPYNETLTYQLCVHCNKPTTKHAHLHSFNENIIKELIPNYKFNYLIFGNKYLGKLRTHFILGFLPFKLWRIFDNLASLIINKPIRFLIEIEKSI